MCSVSSTKGDNYQCGGYNEKNKNIVWKEDEGIEEGVGIVSR